MSPPEDPGLVGIRSGCISIGGEAGVNAPVETGIVSLHIERLGGRKIQRLLDRPLEDGLVGPLTVDVLPASSLQDDEWVRLRVLTDESTRDTLVV